MVFLFFSLIFIYLFILGLCWVFLAVRGHFLVAASGWGLLFVLVCGLLTVIASLVAQNRLQGAQASAVTTRGLST